MYVPDNFTIDPNPYGVQGGSSVGTLTILGNLKVEGTYETLSTTVTENNLEVKDKTILVASGVSDASAAAILSAGILIGGSTISGAVSTPVASLRYQYDAGATETDSDISAGFFHKRYFESDVPIRMKKDWTANHDDELITKKDLINGFTNSGQITFDGLKNIKFKVVSVADEANNWDIGYSSGSPTKMIVWVLNTYSGTLPFKPDGTAQAVDADNNSIWIDHGMNFFVYNGNGQWYSQV